MRSSILAVAAVVLVGGRALAQDAPAPSAAPPPAAATPAPPPAEAVARPAAAPPTAAAPAPAPSGEDAEKLALGRQIYNLFGDQTFASLTQSVSALMNDALAKSGADAAHAQAMSAAIAEGVAGIRPKVVDQSAALWAQAFTQAQLQQILAFFQSPTGRATIDRLSFIADQSTRAAVALLPEMAQGMQASYCRRVICSADETQMFQALQDRMRQMAAGPPPG